MGPPLPRTSAKPEQLVIGTLQDFPNFEPKKSCGDMRVRSVCVCVRTRARAVVLPRELCVEACKERANSPLLTSRADSGEVCKERTVRGLL